MKFHLLILFILISPAVLFSVGQEETPENTDPEKITLTAFFSRSYESNYTLNAIVEGYQRDHPEVVIQPSLITDAHDAARRIKVLTAAGNPVDIIKINNPILLNDYVNDGLLLNLNSLAEKYDLDPFEYWKNASSMLMVDSDLYSIGDDRTQWLLYYNKEIFDRAGIDYPDPVIPMTWDEYRETASLLSTGEGYQRIYGALHLKWSIYWYMSAIQKLGGGAAFYRQDGRSNIEAEEFQESIRMFHQMQSVDKSVPSYTDVMADDLKAFSWLSGRYGMYVHGNWLLDWLKDTERYPRDWKFGIAPIPVYEGAQHSYTWGIVNGFGIGINSRHSDEAFKLIKYIADEKPKFYRAGSLSANYHGELASVITKLANGFKDDDIDFSMFESVLFNSDLVYLSEKITGANSSQYDKICIEELDKFFIGSEDLESRLAVIRKRIDSLNNLQ